MFRNIVDVLLPTSTLDQQITIFRICPTVRKVSSPSHIYDLSVLLINFFLYSTYKSCVINQLSGWVCFHVKQTKIIVVISRKEDERKDGLEKRLLLETWHAQYINMFEHARKYFCFWLRINYFLCNQLIGRQFTN